MTAPRNPPEPKRGPGRPREEDAARRVLSVRMTDAEYGACAAAAASAGESLTAWAKECLLAYDDETAHRLPVGEP